MEIESIKFDTESNVIVITFSDGNEHVFTMMQQQQYLDLTGRVSDLISMGWTQ